MSKAEQRYQRRKEAVSAVQRGESASVVARVMRIPLRTLFSWLARHRAGGWQALREGARSGRPRKVSPEVMQWLYQAITLNEPRQYPAGFFQLYAFSLSLHDRSRRDAGGFSVSLSFFLKTTTLAVSPALCTP